MSGIGLTKASQILFDVVQFYATSASQWEDLAGFAMHAAFDLYSDCDGYPQKDAWLEQVAVRNAFKAIGYTPPLAYGCQ